MSNQKKNKYLIKNTIVFALGNLGSRMISFLLIPLYTSILSTSGYGILDIINVFISIGIPILTLNISEAIMRFLLDKDSDKEKILQVAVSFSFISITLSFLLYPIFKLTPIFSEFALYFCIYIAATAVSGISMCYIRGIEKIFTYSIISIIRTAAIGLLSIVFLVVTNLGIKGFLVAYIISETLTILLCVIFGVKDSRLKLSRPDKILTVKMIKYSFFLIPNSLMWWVINSMDRFMITPMFGIDANGIYAVSSKVPAMVNVFTNIFNQAWMYSAVKEEESKEKDVDYINGIYTVFFKFISLVSIFLIIIIKPLLSVYVGKDFFSAWLYTIPLLVGTVFSSLSTFISSEYTAHKDSKGFLRSASVGASVNLILNLILMPIMGVMGAAIATCISYVSVFIYRALDIRKYTKIKYFDSVKAFYVFTLFFSAMSVYLESLAISIIVYILTFIVADDFIKQLMRVRKKRG